MRLSPSVLSFIFTALTCPSALGADASAEKASPSPDEETRAAEKSKADGDGSAEENEDESPPRAPQPDSPEDEPTPDASEPSRKSAVPEPVDTSEQEAREAFLEGDRLYLEGDYAGAVEAFQRAYSLSGRIEMLFNLANAHERLGNYARASVALRGYIPHSPPEHRPALERRLARFEERAKQRRQKEEKTAEVVKDLKENPRPFPIERSVGIGLLTLGGASIVTGAGFGISALSARSNLNESCEDGATGRLCSLDAQKDLDRDRAHSTVADVTILAGVVGVTVGTVFLIRSKRKEKHEQEQDLDLKLDVGLGPGHVSLGGTF